MACSINHSKLKGVQFCEECGEKVGSASWVCPSGHEVDADHKFCLQCGASQGAPAPKRANTFTASANAFVPNVPSQPVAPAYGAGAGFDPGVSGFIPVERKSNKVPLIIGAVVAALVVIGGIAAFALKAATPQTTDVSVELTLKGEDCNNLSYGYSDIPGAQVVITADGKQVGFGSYPSEGDNTSDGCVFTANVPDVPMNAANYSASLASGKRGVVYYTQSQLSGNNWGFSLSIG